MTFTCRNRSAVFLVSVQSSDNQTELQTVIAPSFSNVQYMHMLC
jgi:hypothetical protein